MKPLLPAVALALLLAACGAQEKTVLVTSKPEGASVYYNDALLGKTPLEIRVRDGMDLKLSRTGHENAQVTITNKSEGVQVITLTAKAGAAAAGGGGSAYPNIRSAKAAYKAGRITESEFERIEKYYEELVDKEKNRLESEYDAGRLGKSEYKDRKKAVEERYE